MNKQELKLYVFQLAENIGVSKKISSIHFRKMKNKIASCSSKGRLTFDISILDKEKSEIKNIIIHELLHFRYPNHGKMFKYTLDYYNKK